MTQTCTHLNSALQAAGVLLTEGGEETATAAKTGTTANLTATPARSQQVSLSPLKDTSQDAAGSSEAVHAAQSNPPPQRQQPPVSPMAQQRELAKSTNPFENGVAAEVVRAASQPPPMPPPPPSDGSMPRRKNSAAFKALQALASRAKVSGAGSQSPPSGPPPPPTSNGSHARGKGTMAL